MTAAIQHCCFLLIVVF